MFYLCSHVQFSMKVYHSNITKNSTASDNNIIKIIVVTYYIFLYKNILFCLFVVPYIKVSLVGSASAKNWMKETCFNFNPSDNIPFFSYSFIFYALFILFYCWNFWIHFINQFFFWECNYILFSTNKKETLRCQCRFITISCWNTKTT